MTLNITLLVQVVHFCIGYFLLKILIIKPALQLFLEYESKVGLAQQHNSRVRHEIQEGEMDMIHEQRDFLVFARDNLIYNQGALGDSTPFVQLPDNAINMTDDEKSYYVDCVVMQVTTILTGERKVA